MSNEQKAPAVAGPLDQPVGRPVTGAALLGFGVTITLGGARNWCNEASWEAVNPDDARRLANLRRRVNLARDFPSNTCGASRHLHMIANQLAVCKPSQMLLEEPQHWAETMLAVLEALWKARTELARLKAP